MNRWVALALVTTLAACGGGGGGTTGPSEKPAVVMVSAAGSFVFHPSASPQQYAAAVEVPLRVAEVNGGRAEWTFARFQMYRAEVKVAEVELNAQQLAAAGYGNVEPLSSSVRTIVFRIPGVDANAVNVFLGFTDRSNGMLQQMYATNFEPSVGDPRPLAAGTAR